MIAVSSLTPVLAQIVVGPIPPSSITLPVQTTTVTGGSTLSFYTVTPSSASVAGSSTITSAIITPSTTEVTGTATLSVFTISPSTTNVSGATTQSITPTTETVTRYIQTVLPIILQVDPLTGHAKTEPDINTVQQVTSTLTPIVGVTEIARTKQLVYPVTTPLLPTVGKVTVYPTAPMPPPLNRPPNIPIMVSQLRSDGSTLILEGETTSESTVIFKAKVSDPDGDMVQLEVELRQIGETFTGEPTPETISIFVPNDTEVMITRYGLANAEYHWRYRARDIKGAVSEWREFGASGNVDFAAQHVYQPPIARLSFYPAEPKAGETVILDASSSFVDGTAYCFKWDLNNDGTLDYISDYPKIEVSWSKSGQYQVKVTVEDWRFNEDSTAQTINVSPSFIERENDLEFTLLPQVEWKIGYTELNVIKEFLNISNGFGAYGTWEAVDSEDLEVCKRLYWLTDTDLLLGLNSAINREALSDLTLGTYILNAKSEIDTVEYIRSQRYKQSADSFWHTYSDINKGWSWLALDLSIQTLINLIPEPITRTAIGLIYISMKFYQRYEGLEALKKELFYNDLWIYLELRSQGDDHDTAWNTPNYRTFVKTNREIEEYFKHLGDTYGAYLTGTGLKDEFKATVRKNFRQMLLSAICNYKQLPDRIKVRAYSPVSVRIYDSQGHIVGLVDGEIKEEIPDAAYDNETKTIVVFCPANPSSFIYEVAGEKEGFYGLFLTSALQGKICSFSAINIPISANAIHQYVVDWATLSIGEEGITVHVDSDGDGVFEHTFTSDSELTHDEFIQQTTPTYNLTITATVGGTTNPSPGMYTYTANSSVQVTAIPDANYIFDHWELDTVNVGSANPYTVLIDNNHTLKALFTYSPAPLPLSVSISPLSASILVGQSVTFTSTVSGGYTPYNYQWYLNGNPVSGATSKTWTFTPSASGIYYVYLKVTDDKGNTAQSDTARIIVSTVPVGGYSIPIQLPTTAKPTTIHIALLTILTAIFIKIKQKTRRKHRQ